MIIHAFWNIQLPLKRNNNYVIKGLEKSILNDLRFCNYYSFIFSIEEILNDEKVFPRLAGKGKSDWPEMPFHKRTENGKVILLFINLMIGL